MDVPSEWHFGVQDPTTVGGGGKQDEKTTS